MTTPRTRSLVGTLEIDGKKQKLEAKQFRLEVSDNPGGAALGPFDGRVVTESFSLSGDTLVTSVTDRNGDTSLDRLTGYKVRDGALVVAASLRGEPVPPGSG